MPYPGHPRGCPNWNKRPTCPGRAPQIQEVLDLKYPVFLVYSEFNLAAHVESLRERHPTWTERQLRCCLYWQGHARSMLRRKVTLALRAYPGTIALYCPEACGVDVTRLMADIGVPLEWPPRVVVRQVALVGSPKSDLVAAHPEFAAAVLAGSRQPFAREAISRAGLCS